MSKCKICGARIEDGVAVCPSCGANVADGTAGQGTTDPASMIRTTCPSCGAEVIGEHRFCDKCGANLKAAPATNTAALAKQERRCPSCGSILQANSAFCPDCGTSLSGSKPATAPTPQAATTTPATTPSPATAANRKVGLTLTPTSVCESTEFFHDVQDLVNSKLMQDKGGDWMLEVEGELTEDEMIFLCNMVIVPGRAIKSLDLSKCSTAYLLKDTQGAEDYLLARCKALETIKLPNRTIERSGSTTTSMATTTQTFLQNIRKTWKKKALKIILVAISLRVVIGLIFIGLVASQLGNLAMNTLEEVGYHHPTVARFFVTPLECTAVSLYDIKEKPILAKVFVHFTTQKNKDNALCYAACFGSPEVMRIFIKNGANVNHKGKAKGLDGDTPLLIAVKHGIWNRDSLTLLIQELIEAGANVYATDKNGKTALMIAEEKALSWKNGKTEEAKKEYQIWVSTADILRKYSR